MGVEGEWCTLAVDSEKIDMNQSLNWFAISRDREPLDSIYVLWYGPVPDSM